MSRPAPWTSTSAVCARPWTSAKAPIRSAPCVRPAIRWIWKARTLSGEGQDVDLTGSWTGVYFYPTDSIYNPFDSFPPTPFEAELTQVGSRVSGRTLEPDMLSGAGAPDIPAVLEGHFGDGVLVFTKFAEGGGHVDPILYEGLVSADGDEIAGTWTIKDDWSGLFRMQRRVVSTETAVEREAVIRT
jgi:hypothetical protein